MQLFDPNNPSERKKAIVAAVLAIVAIAVLGYVFFGSSGTPKKPQSAKTGATPQPPLQTANTTAKPPAGATVIDDPRIYTPVVMTGYAPAFGEPNRNIFAYYEPPPTPPPVVKSPTPIPTPTPPVTLNSLMPAQVYARTADFTLQAMGDKFTPAVRITVDGRELPTRFINAQQVAATVPAALIATPGIRQVTVRSSDGQLYSLASTLNVAPPPIPNYTYIGIIGKPRANDVAVLQDKGSKELLNVQRGDVLGGRFRVTSISERELVLTDTNLKIKHTLPFTTETGPGNPFTRPGPKNADDEP
jgi:hypothetical protein